jgi:hypothetical protein
MMNQEYEVGQGGNGETPGQGKNGQIISDETRSDWARSELEPAQATRNGPDIGNLDQADPTFRTRVEQTLDRLQQQGYQPRVASGVRTLREQIALVRAHRSTTLDSPHVWGFGADIIDTRWGWNVPAGSTYWQDLTAAAQAEGLVSGGTWANFPDPVHVELPGWRNLR